MDFSRAQDRLLSFAVSAMMTSAVLATAPQPSVLTAAAGPQPAQIMTMIEGARSAGFAGMKDMPAPATVAAPAAAEAKGVSAKVAPTLTPAQLLKIRNFALGPGGKQMTMPGALALPLGVGPGDRITSYPGMGASDDETHLVWTIWVLPDNGGYIIGRRESLNASQRYFRMDANMKLILGLSRQNDTATPVGLSPADAAPLFAHDLTEWVDVADAIP